MHSKLFSLMIICQIGNENSEFFCFEMLLKINKKTLSIQI